MKGYKESNYLIIKSWNELKEEFGSFINEDYYDTEEIKIPCKHTASKYFFVNVEVRGELGKLSEMKEYEESHGGMRFISNRNLTGIVECMVKEIPNEKKHPECFI